MTVYINGVAVAVAPAPHSATHEDIGSDEVGVAALSGLLADDQHVLDAEVTAVAIPLAQKAAASGVASLDASSVVVQAAVKSKALSASRDMTAASGAVSYASVGFQPTAYRIHARHSNLLDWSDSHLDSGGVGAGVGLYNGGTVLGVFDATIIIYLQTAGSVLQRAGHTSFDADGITLTYTKVGSPTGTGTLIFMFFK